MRNVVLYISMSLDGHIADASGKVDWLEGQSKDVENKDTYSVFVEGIDTVIMGWNTYHQIVTELSPDEWVYEGFMCYVFTHREVEDTENIKFVSEATVSLVRRLKEEEGKDIWICGGASVVAQLMRENLIDRFHIAVIPTLLGSGVRLFDTMDTEQKLQLIDIETYNGITELVYEKRG